MLDRKDQSKQCTMKEVKSCLAWTKHCKLCSVQADINNRKVCQIAPSNRTVYPNPASAFIPIKYHAQYSQRK